jgi:hypothetical protein
MNFMNPESTILAAKRLVESDKRSDIKLHANGGNSVLVVCLPEMETEYIKAINDLLPADNYTIIDLNDLLIRFVENNAETLGERFELLQGSVHQVFKAPEGEQGNDLYSMIIDTISESYKINKAPVLVNSGALYGSGIDNIHIMESQVVMRASLPLVILYPATREGDKLLFLSRRPASKYRCMILE